MHPLVRFELARAVLRHEYLLEWEELEPLLGLPPRELLRRYHRALLDLWEATRGGTEQLDRPALPHFSGDRATYTTSTRNTTLELRIEEGPLCFEILRRPGHPLIIRPGMNAGRNLALLWLTQEYPYVASHELLARAVAHLFRVKLERADIIVVGRLDEYKMSRAEAVIARIPKLRRRLTAD